MALAWVVPAGWRRLLPLPGPQRGSVLGWAGLALACLATLGCAGEPSDAEATYCDVEPILAARCVRCHQDPQQHGAPFPLLSYGDTQQVYSGTVIYRRMATAVDRGDMPPVFLSLEPPVEDVSDEEIATITAWADAGAPSGGCD